MLAFLLVYRDLCALHAERREIPFDRLLESHWRGAGDLWRRLVDDGELDLPGL
jgi:hypothetical protein